MTAPAPIDVIVTTYNRADLLRQSLESFMACTDLDQIGQVVIANDGSNDGTAAYLAELAQQVSKIRILPGGRQRRGLVPRFNQALAVCTAPLVVEFQDDVQFFPGWLEQQLDAMAAIERQGHTVEFVTGFDAPEHQAFTRLGSWRVKTSTRFTQLTARREVWDRWFPMVPSHPFPTPCIKDGRSIGSNIDTKLSAMRKNDPAGRTRFLVVPGLVHMAESSNSTWRQEKVPTIESTGGVPMGRIGAYWEDRWAREQGLAVGFARRPADEQARILAHKREFIAPHIEDGRGTIDYGCGLGLFADLFAPEHYHGLDITPQFLELAREKHPGRSFTRINPDHLCASLGAALVGFPLEQFFTSNVLQHNEDATVDGIFATLAKHAPTTGLKLALYENTHPARNVYHMRFRTPEEYRALVGRHFQIRAAAFHHHAVHGQNHTLHLFWV